MGKAMTGLVTQNSVGTSEENKTITTLAQSLINSWREQMSREKLENT
jgi:hypothetical protein